MRLLRLTLRNFKGCRELDLVPGGADVSIYGQNAAGKTTIADAFYWLLFDKDSQNRKAFEIKTLAEDGKPIPGLEHAVEAEIETADGVLTLCKVYKAVWTKKRGSASSEFTGHTTEYFINSVPVQKKTFDERVASICDEKTFRLLTDPTFFNEQLPWQDRRKMLLEICGGISDAEVISSNKKLADLPGLMGRHSLDDFRKIVIASREKINGELKQIPVRIDECSRLPEPKLPERYVTDDGTTLTLAGLRELFKQLSERRALAGSGTELAEKVRRQKEIEGELQEIANRERAKSAAANESTLALIREKDRQIADAELALRQTSADLADTEQRISSLQSRIEALREDHKSLSAKGFEGDETCAACGQPLPAERVEEARQAFNEKKARSLAAINAEGKGLVAQADELKARSQTLTASKTAAEESLAQLRTERSQMTEPVTVNVDLASSKEYAALLAQKKEVESEIAQIRSGSSSGTAALDQEIAEVQLSIQAYEAHAAATHQKQQAEERIKELTQKERELSAQYEDLERQLFLTEEFIRAKVSMLEHRINSRFEMARFKLFDQQINGGLTECCEAMVGGVPYGSLNHGARLNCGLDVINTLSDHLGFAPTVFIDGAESLTSILPTRGQQIRLIVSATDPELRIDIHDRAHAQGELISA